MTLKNVSEDAPIKDESFITECFAVSCTDILDDGHIGRIDSQIIQFFFEKNGIIIEIPNELVYNSLNNVRGESCEQKYKSAHRQ